LTFQLNIEKRGAHITLQHVAQSGRDFARGSQLALQLMQCISLDGKPVQLPIMADDGLEVAGQADIEFKAVRTLLKGQIESPQSILRCLAAGAAVGLREASSSSA